jgi:hypothetical protein
MHMHAQMRSQAGGVQWRVGFAATGAARRIAGFAASATAGR